MIGCSGSRDARPPRATAAAPPARGAAPSPPLLDDFAQAAESIVRELRPAVSLRQWLAAHPTDSGPVWFGTDETDQEPNHLRLRLFVLGDWCASTSNSAVLPDGHALLRYAFFYPPPSVPETALPPLADSVAARQEGCRLGLLWMEVPEEDPERRAARAQATEARLRTAFGNEGPAALPDSEDWTTWMKLAWRAGPRNLITINDRSGAAEMVCASAAPCNQQTRGPATVVLVFSPRPTIGWNGFAKEPLSTGNPLHDPLAVAQLEDPGLCADKDSLTTAATQYAARTGSHELRARAHLVAAEAQSDKYVATSDQEVRRTAVGHYASAFSEAPTEALRQRAWDEGWRLAAGLAPTRTHFLCYNPD